MIQTDNLGLKIIEDDLMLENPEETLNGFSDNFKILDEQFKSPIPDLEYLPIGQEFKKTQIIYNSNPMVDDYVGWVNLRRGKNAPKWENRKEYEIGDIVMSRDNNGHVYECITKGTSAYSEPSFPTSTDSEIEDLNLVHTWLSEHNYEVGEIVTSTARTDIYFECIIAGISGIEEPDWGTTIGTTVSDNSVVWLVHKTVKWKEIGHSCNFKPFGKIENE